MGVFAGKFVYARDRFGSGCGNDRHKTQTKLCGCRRRRLPVGHLIAFLSLVCASAAQSKDILRIATLHTGLKRAGPGLLLRDILRGDDPQVLMVRDMIAAKDPDIILVTQFDFDLGQTALKQFAKSLGAAGSTYPYIFSLAPNSGVPTGLDLDGDGRLGGAGDAQGFGDFAGQGGMALLSRYPIDETDVRDFTGTRWEGTDIEGLLLSSVGHWHVPVTVPGWDVPLHVLAYYAGTPAFDGPERRNMRRNAAQNMLWIDYLDGTFRGGVPAEAFVIIGDSNLDPADGLGDRQVMQRILNDPRIYDPKPVSRGAVQASHDQGGPNHFHSGNPALDTADFRDQGGPGNLRVDYVLPSVDLTVIDSGVFWPAADEPQYSILDAREAKVSWHGLVWADITR